ncbi:PTS sugar transporter subunit IIA [Nocardioides mesophilus]|nr:PTS glucose transporter subunit IIA [Nocardioides mesophilus]
MVDVLSPVAGQRQAVSEMPDPVFATGLVGPGAAIVPLPGRQSAVSPIDGTLSKVFPHAYLVVSDRGPAVLVHLGIDTVQLHGDGFTSLAAEHQWVHAGQAIVSWDPAEVERTGRSAMCAVVVLDCPYPAVPLQEWGEHVEASEPLFSIEC